MYIVAKTPNGAYWIGTPTWHKWCNNDMIAKYLVSLPCVDLGSGAKGMQSRASITEVPDADLARFMGQLV
jgi:hypothetical protein